MNKAINIERKQVIKQVAVLALLCILLMIGGRILSGNRFKMTIGMAEWNAAETAEDIQISWEEDKAITVSELSVKGGKDLVLVLEPDRPGEYAMHITGPDGMTILYDELHVDRLGTTYSMQSGNFTGDNAVVGGVALFFLGLAAIALVHFCGFRGPRLYSYDAIGACGVGIFCAVTGLNFLNIFIRRIVQADAMWMRNIYETFSLSGWIFMLITLPAVLAFSLLIIISNIALLRHENFRVQNILGLGIGLLMIASELIGAGLLLYNFSGSALQLRIYYVLSSVYFTTFTYFECILMGSVICGLRAEGLGSRTKWWFWPNAFVRECAGLLANRIVPEAVCLVILILVFGGIATLIV